MLQVDRSYQREDEYKQKVLRMASEWKWESCGAISVMQRQDGSFMIVDGQNRTLAAWKRPDIKELPCLVFESQGIEHEASSFIEINTNRKPVSAYAKFRAKLIAGNPAAIDINNILLENKLKLSQAGKHARSVSCIAACERVYTASPARFRTVIGFASALAEAEDAGVCSILIGGLSYLDQRIPNGLADKKLNQRLFLVGATALVEHARKMSFRTGKGGEAVWAEGMLELINRRGRSKFSFAKAV